MSAVAVVLLVLFVCFNNDPPQDEGGFWHE